LLILGGDDGLQVTTLSPLLAAVAIGGIGDLLRSVDGGLLDGIAVHGGEDAPAAELVVKLARVDAMRDEETSRCGMRYS
jgi:branched-subunit amino acid ABC-type transport system permease component